MIRRYARCLAMVVMLVSSLAAPSFAVVSAAQPAQVAQPEQRTGDGFEPVANLPNPVPEHLPAAPLVMAAYAFVWVMILGYLWSIWRRLGAVEREMKGLEGRIEEAGRRR